MSFSNFDNETLSFLSNLFYKFVWNSKIKRQIITEEYLKGAFTVLEMNRFFNLLKCFGLKDFKKGRKSQTGIFLSIHGNEVTTNIFDFVTNV